MTDILVTVAETGSMWCVALLVSSLLSACAYPAFYRAVAGSSPATRSFAVLCYALMAPAVATSMVFFSTQPEYAQFLIIEHCHDGMCNSHAPRIDTWSLGGSGLIAFSSLLLVGAAYVAVRGLLTGHRRLATLLAFGRRNTGRGYLLVESDDIFAWCCGLLRPGVVVSRGLMDRLSPVQLSLVLAHEQAHVERLDNLRRFVLRWATWLWPRRLRRRACRNMESDSEMACDRFALTVAGHRSEFASIFDIMLPDKDGAAPARGTGFGCSDARSRLQALSADTQTRPAYLAWIYLAIVWLVQVPLVADITHLAVEWIGL